MMIGITWLGRVSRAKWKSSRLVKVLCLKGIFHAASMWDVGHSFHHAQVTCRTGAPSRDLATSTRHPSGSGDANLHGGPSAPERLCRPGAKRKIRINFTVFTMRVKRTIRNASVAGQKLPTIQTGVNDVKCMDSSTLYSVLYLQVY